MGGAVHDLAKNISVNHYAPRLNLRLDMFDAQSVLVVDCGSFCVKSKASHILHDSVGRGVSSGRPFGAGEIVGYYYGALVYLNLTVRKQV